MVRQKTLMTADELLRMPDDDCRHELLDGVLATMSPPGNPHGRVQATISYLLLTRVKPRDLGEVFGEIGIILRRNPDRVRGPDVCFLARDRIPKGGLPPGFIEIIPDLIVEILSPSDRRRRVEQKVQEWLDAGARLVWLVDDEARTVSAREPGEPARVYGVDDTLTGEPVLPGFSIPVREIFA